MVNRQLDFIRRDELCVSLSVSSDGMDLSTPRVFKIHPNTTYVGRDAKAGVGKQYFYVSRSSREWQRATHS